MPNPEQAQAEQRLAALLDQLWELDASRWPLEATYQGDRRFDRTLADPSSEAADAYATQVEAIAEQAQEIAPELLADASQDTRAMVLLAAKNTRAMRACKVELWSIDGLSGPQVDYPMIPIFHTIRSQEDVVTLEARYATIPHQLEQLKANAESGLEMGLTPVRVNLERALKQLDAMLVTPLDKDPLLALSIDAGLTVDVSAVRQAVETEVRPALASYRDFLRDVVLPVAREEVGLGALSVGVACYRAQLDYHIGASYSPEVLHQVGLDELRSAQVGMMEVAEELGLAAQTPREVIDAFRDDPSSYAPDAETLLELNAETLRRAEAAVPRVFGHLPRTPIRVHEMESHRSQDAPAAYYYEAPDDLSRPAYYYVNTYLPETRPLYDLEALAFHEAVPGHHLQIALAKEAGDVHPWRRKAGQTAFVEGWALYSELLADELGLYTSPTTRFGMYNFQAWRAARLVIDTGIHHYGWTRAEALEFLLANTSLPEHEAANEVDRYIAWPGQALAYMVGRREIQSLRQEAELLLGDQFNLSEFHDRLLAGGAMPLTLLRENMERWLKSKQ